MTDIEEREVCSVKQRAFWRIRAEEQFDVVLSWLMMTLLERARG